MIAEDNRLRCGLLFTPSGKQGLLDPFATLPLILCPDDGEDLTRMPPAVQLKHRSALPAVVGGSGVFIAPVSRRDE